MAQGVLTNLISAYTGCFWPFWKPRKPEFDRFGLEVKDNHEIGLDCIEIDFNKNYIGGGNQSSVFRGKWNGRYIALKKLNRASEVDIDKLVKLNHPNVIKTLGISSKEIYPCIIMEYCEQGGLFDVLRRTHVDKKLFIDWSKGIAAGMQYLHSLKIVHRDLKSPNILVDNANTVKICDFGSLYSWDKTYMPSVVMSVCGTSQWMSPEMMKNEPCNEKVDVWSFGVVLWELLFQEVPYKNLPPMAIMFNVGSDRLKLHIPRTAPDCYKLLLKICFAKRPRNRPSFTSILNHLENIRVEIENISDDAWRMRKEAWKKELNDEADKLKHNSNNAEAEAVKVENLVTKRMHELRHAQELNQLYKTKMKRLDKLMDKLMYNLQHIQCMEIALEERERRVAEEEARLAHLAANASCYPSASTSTNPSAGCFPGLRGPELKSVKLQPRPSTVRTNLRSNKTYTE
uniref:Protein kinase domain-containing protein n=1 Tax=Bursaphelenchus xylophilus TaxID=6326 RepID=A0A1I7SFU4_BURXY